MSTPRYRAPGLVIYRRCKCGETAFHYRGNDTPEGDLIYECRNCLATRVPNTERERRLKERRKEAASRRKETSSRDRGVPRGRAKPAGRDLASLAVGAVVGGTLAAVGASLTHRDLKGRLFVLPPNHVPAMVVPHGGSSCANCKYVYYDRRDLPHCKDPGFVIWNRGTRLPVDDARDYCSDWYVPAPGAIAAAAPPRLRRGSR